MLAKRIIPCLDVRRGRVVKGTRFADIKDAGDPVELAAYYDREGADELVFYDIAASAEGRRTMVEVARRAAEQVFIPFTVGGGVGDVAAMRELLHAGADKISINSAAVRCPDLINEGAERFGSQCIVLSIDCARRTRPNGSLWWEVVIDGGRVPTGMDVLAWAEEGVGRGAGELVLNSIDADGTQGGYDNDLNRAVAERVDVPVIASGGAGSLQHLADGILVGKADAVLAASIFHYGRHTIAEAKEYLRRRGIPVR
ncbi:MAG: imidazole glycerol phosphate synthase subunit HisF [Limnochordales bacterium]|nr:MAG: imidazole glycerol phosphate synthase subunit HisF [Bacillota bacterium]HLT57177.1 imidazole glycerol phosphate synthase subunit HisF [Limnochordales bacterium]